MKALKPILKLLISILILFFVLKKIELPVLLDTLKSANLLYLLLAFLLFVISQYCSSLRLLYFFRNIKIVLSKGYNWKLYLLGMYYNLLLPGGIGGDGYKVFILDKEHQAGKGNLIKALLFDRLSGLLALGIWLCSLLGLYSIVELNFTGYAVILAAISLLAILGSYLLLKYFSTVHFPSFFPSLGLSLLIQGLQLAVCLALLASFGANQHILAYLTLFLVSSIAAVIPITFGGAGARELTFLAGAEYFPVEINIAIGLSVIFYIITVLTSLLGLYYSFKQEIK